MTLHFSPQSSEVVDNSFPLRLNSVAPVRRKGAYRQVFKYIMDVTLTLMAAPIVIPVVLVLALFIALDGKSPFYSQWRIGKNGRLFRMWKLRTMVHDADARLEAYLQANPEAKAEWQATQKLKCDPRITRIGRILRKSSMDELPQLLSVLSGSMSLVGPRPMMPSQRTFYPGTGYFRVKPGITGFWQVSDRNNCDFSDRAHYDDLYEQSLSLKTDISVLFRTIGVVIRGTGY